jgi:hypothetical protein
MRQLHLFGSKKQRGRSLPPPMEFNTHVQLADILRRWCNPQWRWTHFPSGENRDHRINPRNGKRYSPTGARLKRMGTQKGWPDFQFFGPQRATFFLELKRPKRGAVSDEQADVLSHLISCGHRVLITTSLDDAVAELKAAGILRSNVELQ